MEEKWPRPFFVGVPVKYSKKAAKLVTIDVKATWEDGTFTVRYKDLTQISFGGDSEKALWATVGGLPAEAPRDQPPGSPREAGPRRKSARSAAPFRSLGNASASREVGYL